MEHRSLRLRSILPAVAFRLSLCVFLQAAVLAACSAPAPIVPSPVGSAASPSPTVQPVEPSPTLPPGPYELRFALVGASSEVNSWALFDETGASYPNYALRSGGHPSLYRLSIPARQFEPYIAAGMPSPIAAEGVFYSATVSLQRGLYWSDGGPLIAGDVAFTVNTAIAYRLRLDWSSAYPYDVLDHAEPLDEFTVKFFFKVPPTIADWQYGALQGPVLSSAYWSTRIGDASALLPSQDLQDSLAKEMTAAAGIQARIDEDNAILRGGVSDPQTREQISLRIQRNQDDLNPLNTKISRLKDELEAALSAARQALFALPAQDEPVFGPYLSCAPDGDTLSCPLNPSYPFTRPLFDTISYRLFPDEASALAAFNQEQVDVVLAPHGILSQGMDRLAPTSSLSFLAFNPGRPELADPILHQALACVIDLQSSLGPLARPLGSFVPSGPWQNASAALPCSGLSPDARIEKAVQILGAAGYSWTQPPGPSQVGLGLLLPGGVALRPLVILAVSSASNSLRFEAAGAVAAAAQSLGIAASVQAVDPATLRYRVYSTRDYDMAVLGWSVSEYPAYLCDWFQSPGPFAWDDAALASACRAMTSTADLATTMQAASAGQARLVELLPFIPLYQSMQYEAVRGVAYPFDSITNGISGLYGAPALASPLPTH